MLRQEDDSQPPTEMTELIPKSQQPYKIWKVIPLVGQKSSGKSETVVVGTIASQIGHIASKAIASPSVLNRANDFAVSDEDTRPVDPTLMTEILIEGQHV